MSPNNFQPKQPTNKLHGTSNGRKSSSARPLEQNLKCPRCDSPNTKFCYYNNYSLTQPRHFCRTCRRYWTNGGAIRNVPIGGGCRKNKKMKSSSSRLSSTDSKDSSGSSEIGGFRFFHGLSPAMDFNLGALSSLRRLNNPANSSFFSQFSSFDGARATSPSCFSLDHRHHHASDRASLMEFNYPLPGYRGAIQETANSSMDVHTSLASSIESLSSINQDLHWKLQQQRLAMLFGEENHKDGSFSSSSAQKPQTILFQNLDISKPESTSGVSNSRKDGGNTETEWFFGDSYGSMSTTSASSNGAQVWSEFHQYNGLP